jgi:hypothetical protein
VLSEYFPNPTTDPNSVIRLRVHRKHGAIFALSPVLSPTNWVRFLPAQSAAARVYRWVARLARRTGISFPRETIEIAFDPANPLLSLAKTFSQASIDALILPGNPQGVAPRLVILCADENGRPALAIKAGHSAAARNLIRQERAFLSKLRSKTTGHLAPQFLNEVETSSLSAFATEFVDGPCPSSESSISLRTFLSSCIDTSRTIPLAESPLWAQLTGQQSEPSQLFSLSAFSRFSSTRIHPCIFHGDFAPWNIRETPDGTWKAIDWERGGLDGIPGWDWFHFVLQPAILVKKWKTERVIELGRQTIFSPNFLTYLDEAAPEASKNGFAEFLLRSYFLYNWHVLQPTERKEVHEALARWAGTGK